MDGFERSLLTFIDTPLVVGDAGGDAVWANPTFETRFTLDPESLAGTPLAELFAGGSRERVLNAVALVCEGGESQRFRLREGGHDYEAVVSGIEVGAECVGVVILLKETMEHLERLLALQRQLQEPLDEVEVVLDGLLEQTGGQRADRHRKEVEDGLRALARIRKWSQELGTLLCGDGSTSRERFDPVAVLRRVTESASDSASFVEMLAPASLPALEGDPMRLEWALGRMLDARLAADPARIVLGARVLGDHVLLSVSELVDEGLPGAICDTPDVRDALAELRAEVETVADPRLGRSTLLRVPMARGQ